MPEAQTICEQQRATCPRLFHENDLATVWKQPALVGHSSNVFTVNRTVNVFNTLHRYTFFFNTGLRTMHNKPAKNLLPVHNMAVTTATYA